MPRRLPGLLSATISRLAITTTTDELLIALAQGEGITTQLSLLDALNDIPLEPRFAAHVAEILQELEEALKDA